MAVDSKQAEKYIEHTLKMIKSEIDHILNDPEIDPLFYEPYKNSVEICDEQIFAKKKDVSPNHIYIVVKFGTASFDFGQALMPVTINAVSEQNKLDVCQKLLFDLATIYTQSPPIEGSDFPETDYVKQIWNTPNVINNFNEINVGFRSLFYMTGTILIGHNSSPIEELWFNLGEEDAVPIHQYMITFSDSFDVYPDTQAFYTTNGIGKTEAKTASYAFSITLFKTNNVFMNLCKAIKRGDLNKAPDGICTKFLLSMRDKDDFELDPETGKPIYELDPETGEQVRKKYYFTIAYTMVNMTIQQNKGDLPTVALTFAR